MRRTFFVWAGAVSGLLILMAGAGATTIYDVQHATSQGSGDNCYPSTRDGQTITLTGVVTGVKAGSYNDFFLQEADSVWSGIYYYQNDFTPQEGDSVTVTAVVDEYFGMTEMKNVSSWTIHSSGHTLPDPIDISTRTLAGGCSFRGEKYEGLLVRVRNVVVTQEADGYGQWFVADTSGVACEIEDGLFHYEPSLGDTCLFIVGAVTYSFEKYEINPRDLDDIGCGVQPQVLSIYDVQHATVQGTGNDCYPSPHEEDLVTIDGVVTGVTKNTPYDNFWIQDFVGGWSGVYIFDNSIHPSVGDSVSITGFVSEYYGVTEVSVSSYEILQQGVHEIDPIMVTAADLAGGCSATGESFEGVLVRIENAVVTDTSGLGAHGEWYVSDDDGDNQCQIDDLCFLYEPMEGDTFLSITGVVHYANGDYEIDPRNALDIVPVSPVVTLKIYHIDVGQGDATLMISPTGETLLMDGGPYNSGDDDIVPLMITLGIADLDYMVASHYDADHVGGLDEVVDAGYLPGVAYDRGDSVDGNQFNQYLDAIRSVRQTIDVGGVIDLGGGVTATCYTVNAEVLGLGSVDTIGTDQIENSLSVGLLVEYGDFEYWISGDLTGGGFSTADVEFLAASALRDVDVLHTSHHGSNTSTNYNFLRRLIPEVAIVSVGNNPYSHPHQDVLDRLNALPMMDAIYQTETGSGGTASKVQVANGTVLIETDGSKYTVSGGALSPTSYSVDEIAYPPRVVINEIMKDPNGSDEVGEWFELFNATDQVVDIDGWVIRDEDYDYHTINNGGPLEIEPYGYLALARSGSPGGFTPDYVYGSDISLGNGLDEIILMDGSVPVDWVFYDDEVRWTDGTGNSMQLCYPFKDNNYWVNWDVDSENYYGSGGYGTPGTHNGCFQVSVGDDVALQTKPECYLLLQNYPNPFNPITTISYNIPTSQGETVTLRVYNIAGQVVRTLMTGHQSPGYHQIVWDGMNDRGHEVASGVYLYRLQAGEHVASRRMVLLR